VKPIVGFRRRVRRPSGFTWLILSAVLFLSGAPSFRASQSPAMAELGTAGAVPGLR
jgi:hypothetical protein